MSIQTLSAIDGLGSETTARPNLSVRGPQTERPGARLGVLGHGDDADARIHERDCLYQRVVVDTRSGERLVEYRRWTVAEIVVAGDDVEHAYAVTLRRDRRHDDGSRVTVDDPETVTLAARPLLEALASDDPALRHVSPTGDDVPGDVDGWTRWESVRDVPHAAVPVVESCGDLTFQKVERRGSRNLVNWFLEGGADGLVDHAIGGVSKWLGAFVARYDPDGDLADRPVTTGREAERELEEYPIVAALVIDRHPKPGRTKEHGEVNITRLASHPNRPHNCSSWLIARARKWAAREDYEVLSAFAGVAGNLGVAYEAAGFDRVSVETKADGSGWTNDRGDGCSRQTYADGGEWTRTKWVYEL